MSCPEISRMLTLCTAIVPREIREAIEDGEGHNITGFHAYAYGWLMWVPDSPDEQSDGADDDDDVQGDSHPTIIAIRRYARHLDCEWVRFDEDAPCTPIPSEFMP